jgi:hypothetical protein
MKGQMERIRRSGGHPSWAVYDNLVTENESLKTDAERWKFFQRPDFRYSGPVSTDGDWSGYVVYLGDTRLGRGETLQDAIDSAIKKTQ